MDTKNSEEIYFQTLFEKKRNAFLQCFDLPPSYYYSFILYQLQQQQPKRINDL